jgi:hypothetical protein
MRIVGLGAALVAALAIAGGANGGLSVGVSEDRGKAENPGAFFATFKDLGLTENRSGIVWDPSRPDVISAKASIQSWLPLAKTTGVRVIFAVTPAHASDLSTPAAASQFAAFVGKVAKTFPQVKDYVIGNEPNRPYFWRPQYSCECPDGKPLSAAAYEPVLAQSYDALKSVDPTINVIGVGLSPRGRDNPAMPADIASRSPVRFISDLGKTYLASGRKKPIMDELAFHPYPAVNTDPPSVGDRWPNAGLPNLDRIKQAVWDAFHGTKQPTFAERGRQSFAPTLRLDLDEIGWQVGVLPSLTGLYFGTEPTPTIDEATQALYYTDVLTTAECDPNVRALSFFLLEDESDLTHWQSGLERADGSHRPSYDAVKQTIAQTHGNCLGEPLVWSHTSQVISPFVGWRIKGRVNARRTSWHFSAGADEEITYRAGIFKARTSRRAIKRSLATGRPRPALSTKGKIKARTMSLGFPHRRLKPGRYVFAIRMAATMNPARTSLYISRAFTVGSRR